MTSHTSATVHTPYAKAPQTSASAIRRYAGTANGSSNRGSWRTPAAGATTSGLGGDCRIDHVRSVRPTTDSGRPVYRVEQPPQSGSGPSGTGPSSSDSSSSPATAARISTAPRMPSQPSRSPSRTRREHGRGQWLEQGRDEGRAAPTVRSPAYSSA